MTIQSLTGKTNNVVLPSKSNQAENAKNTSIDTTKQTEDTVDITAVAKEINKASEASDSTVNQERVTAIKNALADRTYAINAEKIATKMIEMEQI